MKIQTYVNDQLVELILVPIPPKNGEPINFNIKHFSWMGKEGEVLTAEDKEFQNILDYINKSTFQLPPIKIEKFI